LPKDAYYFSHDANARHDPKIIALRSVYGAEGYGWYWMIVEMMREQENYRLSLNSSRYTFQILSNQLQCTPEKAKQFIDDCIGEFGLFQSDGDSFWSESLVRRMKKREELREIRSEAGRRGGENRAIRMKIAKSKGSHTKEEWDEMVALFDNKCVRCGADIEGAPTKDHIIPIYQGGSDSIFNIQPLCKQCNSSKGPENIDFRETFCEKHGKQMLGKWLAKSTRKGKESKVNKSKVNKRKEKIPSGVLVLKYLNKISNRNFQKVHKYTTARLKEYSNEDLVRVIQWKNYEWGVNPEMRKFLRQETLFAPGHFDTYLTEAKEHEHEVFMTQYEEYCRELRTNYKGDRKDFKEPTFEEFVKCQNQNLKNMNSLDQSKEDEKG
jgi:uncharacterized phage protein (TIGR02220 family)